MATTMNGSRYLLVIGAILCVMFTKIVPATSCEGEGAGRDLGIRIGSELVINCTINVTCRGVNSSSLSFKFNPHNETQEHENVSEANVRQVSSSQLQLRIPKVKSKNRGVYFCVLKNDVIGAPTVTVDYAPQLPTGFHCISNNQRDMNCTFNYPIKHFIKPKFNISFTITWFDNCPAYNVSTDYRLLPDVKFNKDTLKVSCEFPQFGDLQFRKYSRYCFVLEVVHNLGKRTTAPYTVDSDDAIVKPDPVRELKIEALDSYSLQVSWQSPKDIEGLIRNTGLDYMLVFHSNWDPDNKTTRFINESHAVSSMKIVQNLTHLLPHTTYIVTITTKPSIGHYWSEPTTKSSITNIAVPKHSPVIPPGGFRVDDDSSKIRLYLETIKPKDQYGDLKAYDVVFGGDKNISFYKMDNYWIDIVIDKKHAQTFELYARNDAGRSLLPTRFTVTDFDKLPGYPSNVAVEASSDERSVTLTWNPPDSNPHGYVYKQYVIYICKMAGFEQNCASPLQYRHINASYSSVQVNVLEQYGFEVADAKIGIATAATTKGTIVYSGISWQCLYRSSTSEKSPSVDVPNYGVDQANVTFEPLTCKDSKARVKHYEVFYCEAKRCSDTTNHITIRKWADKKGEVSLNSLVPLTKYKYWAVAVTALGPGKVTEEDQRKSFKTQGLELNCSVMDEHNPGEITFSVSNYKKSKYVCAQWSSQRGTNQISCRNVSGGSGIMPFDCGNDVNGFLVKFAVYQDVEKSKRLSELKEKKVCQAPPLSSGAIAGIVIAAVIIGTILAVLGYYFRRAIMEELRRCREFKIKMPMASDVDKPLRRKEDHQDVFYPHCPQTINKPNRQPGNGNLISHQDSNDSGRETVCSTSSVTIGLLDPQVSESPNYRCPNITETISTEHDSGQHSYVTNVSYNKDLVHSNSYIDNEDQDEESSTPLVVRDYNNRKTVPALNGYAQFTMTGNNDSSCLRMKVMDTAVPKYPSNGYSQFALPSKGVDLIQNTLSSELPKSSDADSLAGFAVVNVPVTSKDTLPPFDLLNLTYSIKANENKKDPKFENRKDPKLHYKADKDQIDHSGGSSEEYAVYGENGSTQSNRIQTGAGTVVNYSVMGHVPNKQLSSEAEQDSSGIEDSNSSGESLPTSLQGRDSGYMSPAYQDLFTPFSVQDKSSRNIPHVLNNKETVLENNMQTSVNIPENVSHPPTYVSDKNGYVCVPEMSNIKDEDENVDISHTADLQTTEL